jgi:hypothetical protein
VIRRLVWFVSGVAAGLSAAVFGGRRVKRRVVSLAPVRVVGRATEATRVRFGRMGEAFREGRDAMRQRESELKARRDGRIETLATEAPLEPIGPNDEVLVDGRRVEPGRVIVLRQMDETPTRRRHRPSRRGTG